MANREQILDKALQLGSEQGWETLTLNRLAACLSLPLSDIYRHYRQKDELADAWFNRADKALMEVDRRDGWPLRTKTQRLNLAIFEWLDTLAIHRKLTGTMLLYKFEPGHIHLQGAGLLRISRTVQKFREVAGLEASHLKRISQEIILTKLYLLTFCRWLNDSSVDQQLSRQFLHKKLSIGERFDFWT